MEVVVPPESLATDKVGYRPILGFDGAGPGYVAF